MIRPKGLFVLDGRSLDLIYGPQERRDIESRVDLAAPPLTAASLRHQPGLLAETELLFTGWGGPVLDDAFLESAPQLKAVFYGSGSVSRIITPAVWRREVAVVSAYAANAVPVAEYTLSVILFSLKHGWRQARATPEQRRQRTRDAAPGCLGSTVGLVSMGMVARTLRKLLAHFDVRVLAFDPFLEEAEAAALGVERVSLESLFRRCDVVSVHTPLLPETRGMITGAHLTSMKSGATFVNTARGAIVREGEMLGVLARRPDLQAVLDVSTEEPPADDSPLYTLANVVSTPHIAGSVGAECRRMGRLMVEELTRHLAGEPLRWRITPELAEHSCHRPERLDTSAAGN